MTGTSTAVPHSATRSITATAAWGLFCACSWTWCIGLYLPKIMLERFGLVGVLVFAVPNILGCAAFGYVLTRERSRRLVEEHGQAMVVFSLVAIAFQAYFVAMLLRSYALRPTAPDWMPLVGVLVVFILGGFGSLLKDRGWLILSVLTYVFSIVVFGMIGVDDASELLQPWFGDRRELIWIGPVVAIGLLLCPYLDLTFHRALQTSPSRHAFLVFGVTFAVMLALTCFLWFSLDLVLMGIGLGHLVAQIAFTIGAHLREVRKSPALCCPTRRRIYAALPLLAGTIPIIAHYFTDGTKLAFQRIDNQNYIRFLVFYGLAFPAYALVFMGPGRPAARTGRNLTIFVAVIVLLAPLYELGFLHRYAWVLSVPLALAGVWIVARSFRSWNRSSADR